MADSVRFFLDTASIEEIRRWSKFDLVEGVTTNPALLSKEGGDPLDQLLRISDLVDGPVSAQVTTTEPAEMIVQGRALARLSPNIVVKLPATQEGCRAAQSLTAEGIDCNITLTFDPAQAIPFVRIPVAYLSLIIGRVEDFGLQSTELVRCTREMIYQLRSPTQLLVASIRNPHHLRAAVCGGAQVVTVPPATWNNIYANPLSHQGENDFFTSWRDLAPEMRRSYEELGRDKEDPAVEEAEV